MRRFRSLTIVLFAAIGLGACAAPEIPFDRSTAPDVKTIGMITPIFPKQPTVWLASSVGQSFGLIGALVDAGLQGEREKKFQTVLVGHNYVAQDAFTDGLVASLQAQGYVVVQVPLARDKNDFAKKYPPADETKVDAYLDTVTLAYGYIAAGISSSNPYRPSVVTKVKLVRARDSSVLMQDLVFYNPVNNPKKIVTIAPDPAYQFPDFDSLMANQDQAVEGLRVAIKQTTQTISALMK